MPVPDFASIWKKLKDFVNEEQSGWKIDDSYIEGGHGTYYAVAFGQVAEEMEKMEKEEMDATSKREAEEY